MPSVTGTEQAVMQLRAARAFDLHQTHAAARHRVQLGVAAKDGNLDLERRRGVHHQCAGRNGDLLTVDSQGYLIAHTGFYLIPSAKYRE